MPGRFTQNAPQPNDAFLGKPTKPQTWANSSEDFHNFMRMFAGFRQQFRDYYLTMKTIHGANDLVQQRVLISANNPPTFTDQLSTQILQPSILTQFSVSCQTASFLILRLEHPWFNNGSIDVFQGWVNTDAQETGVNVTCPAGSVFALQTSVVNNPHVNFNGTIKPIYENTDYWKAKK